LVNSTRYPLLEESKAAPWATIPVWISAVPKYQPPPIAVIVDGQYASASMTGTQ
jgi:hypothetical protein